MKGRDWWLLLVTITALSLVVYGLSMLMTGCMAAMLRPLQ